MAPWPVNDAAAASSRTSAIRRSRKRPRRHCTTPSRRRTTTFRRYSRPPSRHRQTTTTTMSRYPTWSLPLPSHWRATAFRSLTLTTIHGGGGGTIVLVKGRRSVEIRLPTYLYVICLSVVPSDTMRACTHTAVLCGQQVHAHRIVRK